MSQRRIAVLIAGMLVGAQVGIAAIDGSSSATEEYAEPAPAQAEVIEQGTATEQVAASEQAPTGEQLAAVETGYLVPARPRTLADATFPPLHSDVFPPSTDDRPLLPSLVAYLDRKAANTELSGAAEPVFPPSDEGWQMLPVQVAYFERLEATRVAAAEAQSQPSEEKTPGTVGVIEGSATAGSGG
jgi:hypothetical protein